MNFMTFHILGIVTPTDFHIFQRGRYTTNQIKCLSLPSDVWLFGTRSLPGNVIDYVFKWAAGRGSERGRHVKSRLTRLAFNNTFVCTKGISWIMIQTYPNSDKSVGCLFATFMESRKKQTSHWAIVNGQVCIYCGKPSKNIYESSPDDSCVCHLFYHVIPCFTTLL